MEERSRTLEIIRRVGAPEPEKIAITGILKSPDLALLVLTLPGADEPVAALLGLLGAHGVNIRFITLYDSSPESKRLTLCVDRESFAGALELLHAHEDSLGIRDLSSNPRVRIISIYPYRERALVAKRLLTGLRFHGVKPLAVNNATSLISCVLDSEHVEQALTSLDQLFELP